MEYKYSNEKISNRETITYFLVKYEDAHKRIEESISSLKSEIQVTLFNHEKRISNLEGNLVPSF